MLGLERARVFLTRRQRRSLLLLLAGSVLAAALEMGAIGSVPLFVGLLLDPDRVVAGFPIPWIQEWLMLAVPETLALAAAIMLVGLFMIKNAFVATLNVAEGRVMRDVRVAVASRLFSAYLLAPYVVHLRRNPAELIRNVEGETTRALEFLTSSIRFVREGLVLAVICAIILMMDPAVSSTVFILMAAAGGLFYVSVRRVLGRRALEAQANRARQLQSINQGLGAVKEARILGREKYLIDRFTAETRAIGEHERYFRLMSELPRLFLEVAAVGAVLLVAALFIVLERSMEAMLPMLALLAVAGVRLVPAFNVMTISLARIRYERPSFDLTCNELEDMERRARAEIPDHGRRPRMTSAIEIDDVHYRYPGAATDALRGISLEIRKGEAIGLIGPSGAGKSTLADVILGLLTPTKGRVSADGLDIHEELQEWQREIGYVPQEPYLLDDTIRRNVAFGLPDGLIDSGALMRALDAAQLGSFVEGLPGGVETVIGNRGVRLAGGQRQRLAIARALYRDPSVLVMDEAMSALDIQTERTLIQAIGRLRGERTVVVIAHRLTTVRVCDRLYLLHDGRVEDSGTYDELVLRRRELVSHHTGGGATPASQPA